ncbi:hypothetical protein K1T71_011519 [Dendrolimus kikuchii]|uniref:Uncharacterized protein n=1 Tax=Dendrolimus kikuchii TaxID=765133 RepID=A0ACC1CP14_9NEOP|nr:hypothetical protein K1T71_011519 [Dendrolimus kikuchii]
MFIEDIRNDFYNVLLGNRVLLLVHYDVDAICTCKILQGLFKSDNISYTLIPVGGISELKTAYEENNEEIKYVLLVNCGGTIDLVDILQPEEDVVFFVLDAHKPTDVCNVYSDGQVRLVYKDEEENIPNFDDIFRDDEDENEDEPETGREGVEALVERRRERRAWEERRNTLMFNYTQFSYYGKPSACVTMELAWRVSRCGCGAVWAGSVAAAAQAALHSRAAAQIPLQQARQAYRSMDVELRHTLLSALEGATPKHKLPSAAHTTFLLRRPLSPPLAALDLVYAIMGLIEHESIPRAVGFQHALSALETAGGENESRRLGWRAAQEALQAVARLVNSTLSNRQLHLAGPFSYFIVQEGTPEAAVVRGPLWLGVAARWAAKAASPSSGSRPVVASAPQGSSTCIVMGIPPRYQDEPRNLFGAAFEQAATKSGVSVALDHVDSSIITLPISQRTQFLDALTALLA